MSIIMKVLSALIAIAALWFGIVWLTASVAFSMAKLLMIVALAGFAFFAIRRSVRSTTSNHDAPVQPTEHETKLHSDH
jgi:membrane protein implicated in regulation of membrane protease activity